MKNLKTLSKLAAVLVISMMALSPALADADKWPSTKAGEPTPSPEGVSKELLKNLANFDDLDFRVYTGQQWQDLHKSHSKNIVVHWPDGHTTTGIEKHIEDLKYMFTFAPDNRITEHPIRFGTEDALWTAVTGWIEGTFTQPMALADGTSIPATGKSYRIPMATIGRWNKDGVMEEEWLFWDNAAFMKQIGL